MNLHVRYSPTRSMRGFTLMELMAVIAIMITLAALTMVGFKSAQVTAARNRTSAFHKSISVGLEQYFQDAGEYPTPRDTSTETNIQGKRYIVGPAKMLYQVLSSDGDDQIVLGQPRFGASDGQWNSEESKYIRMTDMPKELKMRTNDGIFLIDGFNKPFQYTKGPDRPIPGQPPAVPNTMNTTFDLWSFAEADKNTTNVSIANKRDINISGKWIKNW
jgi:prepilin-type N-terminal cleavage/methylation domain-containing protein